MTALPVFKPDRRRPQRGGALARKLGICVSKLSDEGVAFLTAAIDIKRNYIRPSHRRDAIWIMRYVLKLDPLDGFDIHKVWPSLKPGPISTNIDDYVIEHSSDPSEFVYDPAAPVVHNNDWDFGLPCSVIEFLKRRPSGRTHIDVLMDAIDPLVYEIRPERRRQVISILRDVLRLDPLNGRDIHKVWHALKPWPISDDPVDYECHAAVASPQRRRPRLVGQRRRQ